MSAKPRITAVSPTYFRVTHRDVQGVVAMNGGVAVTDYQRSSGGERWWCCIDSGECNAIVARGWTSESVFDRLVARMDEIADCREACIASDKAETQGVRFRLHGLGGDSALAAYDAALAKLQADDGAGLTTVLGMLKTAAAKKLPKPVTQTVTEPWGARKQYTVTTIKNFSVTVGERTYYIGQQAEHGAYNLHYFGEILGITEKTVLIQDHDRRKRLSIDEFARRNADDPQAKHECNVDTMRYI